MFDYFQTMCENSKNLSNTTNFYIRQIYTGLTRSEALQPLQIEVLDELKSNIEDINITQQNAYERKLSNELKKPKERQKNVKRNLFSLPDSESPFIGYNLLDALFKSVNQPDYRAMPTQASQGIMRIVYDNWKSFFASIKDWKANSSKYLGKPKIPGYIRASTKETRFTNQDCVIKNGRYLKFPKTKNHLNIGKLGRTNKRLKEVRVIPKYGQFVVEIIFEKEICKPMFTKTPKRLLTIDLGIDNLATITTNTGTAPVLLKGGNVKSINQYYNKKRAYYYGILRQGKQTNEGEFTSRRLINLDAVRHRKLKDIFHKSSAFIVKLAILENVDTIIIGQNKGWKQKINIGKKNNQSFVQIPFGLLINMITYKAMESGINVIIAEESYTSQASFIDKDEIPVYGEVKKPTFSGKRIARGLYRTKYKLTLNADVNGSANIMRKFMNKKGLSFHIEDVETTNPCSYIIA